MVLKFNDLTAEDERPRSFRLNHRPDQLIVIGCGGTGGYLIPDLFRATRFAYQEDRQPKIILVDGDIVEGKNIKRQNFIEKDMGHFKAEVMAKRYGQAFGLEVAYITNYLEDPKLLGDLVRDNHNSLIISCVDSLYTRKLIYDYMASVHRVISSPIGWLDSGNEDTFGQVVFTCSVSCDAPEYRKEQLKTGMYRGQLWLLPSIVELFPHILTAKQEKRTINCAVQAEERPQNILINRMAATVLLRYAYKILYNDLFNSYMTTFDVNKGIHDHMITIKNMKQVWKQAYPDLKL